MASSLNEEIVVRNININCPNTYGVIYVPLDTNYAGILTTYDSINFNGTRLAYKPYGKVKIVDSYIVIEETSGIASQEVCMGNYVIIGGKTTITSSSTRGSLFYFRNNLSPSIVFLCQSNVSLSTDTKEFMTGTNRLNFTILHDTEVNIVTAENTPADNYNLQFKGSSCKLILENPNSVILYSKNASVFYFNNTTEYQIKCKRINLWNSSKTLTSAGDIHDLPDYS